MIIHIVRAGDSIYTIARKYGVTPTSIIQNNALSASTQLVIGQTLVILFYDRVYTVRDGDTLASVAAANGVTVNQLLRNNPILGKLPTIYPGQTLVISYTQEKIGKLTTNGYVYPFIDQGVLRQTLPYLSYLTVFTYGFKTDGTLVVPDDTDVLRITRENGVSPIMLISTLTGEGSFSNELAHTLFADPALQDKLIDNIIATMKQKGYTALDIDFEYIFAYDADPYVAFASKITKRLNAAGYKVYVSLAPKTSATQPGLLYEGHNYAGLGAAADGVLLMTYEWGYTYGPAMAVAPINNVREVVDFAVTQIPPEKIMMGIPNYGYDWTLPFVKGSKATSLSNVKAVELAAGVKAAIEYDETSQAPFFYYYKGGVQHVVWFEDARSIRAKLALISEYKLRGASWWNIMNFFPQNWLVVNSLYEIEQ